jgi:hypothetical protein
VQLLESLITDLAKLTAVFKKTELPLCPMKLPNLGIPNIPNPSLPWLSDLGTYLKISNPYDN